MLGIGITWVSRGSCYPGAWVSSGAVIALQFERTGGCEHEVRAPGEARRFLERWRLDHNRGLPDCSLGSLTREAIAQTYWVSYPAKPEFVRLSVA